MSDTIPPALTPEQWQRKHWGWASWELVEIRRRPDSDSAISPLIVAAHPHGDGPPNNACITVEPQMVATIALANDALPADSLYKITREWVTALRKEAERGEFAERTGDNAGYSAIDPEFARHMANVLAALLPPE